MQSPLKFPPQSPCSIPAPPEAPSCPHVQPSMLVQLPALSGTKGITQDLLKPPLQQTTTDTHPCSNTSICVPWFRITNPSSIPALHCSHLHRPVLTSGVFFCHNRPQPVPCRATSVTPHPKKQPAHSCTANHVSSLICTRTHEKL